MPHSIRLRGPWEYVPQRSDDSAIRPESAEKYHPVSHPAGITTIPGDWGATLGNSFRGAVLYRRRFHSPSGITDLSRLGLVIEAVDFEAEIRLNHTLLGRLRWGDPTGEFEITSLLVPYNVLEIVVELSHTQSELRALQFPDRVGLPGGILGEVRIEIFD